MAAPAKRSSSTGVTWLLLGGLIVGTFAALFMLMKTRFDDGVAWPHYSTMRPDPTGTRVLLEALQRLPGVTAEQNFRPLKKLEGKPGQALVLCGLDPMSFHQRDVIDAEAVSRFVVSGGRLIIALNPNETDSMLLRAYRRAQDEQAEEDERGKESGKKETQKDDAKAEDGETDDTDKQPKNTVKPAPESKPPGKGEQKPADNKKPDSDKTKDKKSGDKSSEKKKPRRHVQQDSFPAMASVLKIGIQAREYYHIGQQAAEIIPISPLPLSKQQLPGWYSNCWLDDSDDQEWERRWALKRDDEKADKKPSAHEEQPSPWTMLAVRGNHPCIAERRLGAGTVVICSDRFFLSNEALWKEPKNDFLAWLLGGSQHIIFDETSLGPMIGDAEGVMTLARRYGMHGLFLGGLVLFALLIWRFAFSLVPSTEADDLGLWREDAVAGQSTASGLKGLLRRGIKPGALIAACWQAWETSRAAQARTSKERQQQAAAICGDPAAIKNPVATYLALREALNPKYTKAPPSSQRS